MKLMFTDYELCSLFLIIWIFTKIINELQLWKMYKRSIQKLHENGIRFLVRAIIKTEYLNFFLFYSTYWEKLFLWEKEKSAVVFLSKLTYDTYILILSSYYFKADQLLFFLRGRCQRAACRQFFSMFDEKHKSANFKRKVYVQH